MSAKAKQEGYSRIDVYQDFIRAKKTFVQLESLLDKWEATVLPSRLKRHNLRNVGVTRDGSCLYRGGAHGFFTCAERHSEVRQAVDAHVRSNMGFYKDFYAPDDSNDPATIDEAIKEMESANT